jgi:citrate lyase subunit beta / citryl-CoA lyase
VTTPNLGLIRTALFVPGNQSERVDKAVKTSADAVIVDLEDAVPHSEKVSARHKVKEKILQHRGRRLLVRINGIGSKLMQGDVAALMVDGLSGVVVPKVSTPEDIAEINRVLCKAEQEEGLSLGTILVVPLIESALAVQNIYRIVTVKTDPPRIYTVAFGAGDFTLDLGVWVTKEAYEILYARSRVVVACRAAGLPAPLDAPFIIDLHDQEGLRADAQNAKQIGFQGKLCVHPNQVEICNEVFSPTAKQIDYARRLIQAFEEAEARGIGALQFNGELVDYPTVERSRRILKTAELLG